MIPGTPYEALLGLADPSQPLVTHYSGPDARVELSGSTAANLVAKAAGLVRDELGLVPGDTASVDLPRHWQLPIWVWAVLSAGLRCGRDVAGRVELRVVAAADLATAPPADEVLCCSCDAFGMPVPTGLPPGITDTAAARSHPDRFAAEPAAAGAPLLVGSGPVAWQLAAAGHGPGPGPRAWVDEATGEQDLLVAAAIAPLVQRRPLVIAVGLSAEQAQRVRAAEGVAPA